MRLRQAVEDAHCVVGVFTNGLLIYCIRRHTKLSLGAYKQLLTIFASFDIFLTILHGLVDPRIFIVNSTFGISSNSDFLPMDRAVPSFYVSCFSVPFALMNIHFLYRYWTVSRPHLIPLFSSIRFIAGLVAVPAGVFITWYLLCIYELAGEVYNGAVERLRSQLEQCCGKNRTKGWIVMDWSDPAEQLRLLPSFIIFDSIVIVSFSLALTLAILTFRGIRQVWKISRSRANLQFRLFIAVIAQTLVPVVCVYIPYFLCLTLPSVHLPASLAADLAFFLTSCFPAWDAVIIIILMTDYRHAVVSYLPTFTRPRTIPGVSQMTTIAMTVVPRKHCRVGPIGYRPDDCISLKETTTVTQNSSDPSWNARC